MDFSPITVEGFNGREEALRKIKRYIHEKTKIMYYRTNDLLHSRRVLWHIEEAAEKIKLVYNDFDVEFARTLALVHDDVEIITGDVQLREKEMMDDEQREILSEKEKNAIPMLVKMYYHKINGLDYEILLFAAKQKKMLEAQFVSFFDKFDGAGEAWHEVWAGNKYFLDPACGFLNESKDNKMPSGGYIRRLSEFPNKYPDMKKFFDKYPEYIPKPFDFISIAENSKPHTKESLEINSGYPNYELWKRTIMKREGIENLITQIEFQ